MELKPFHGTKEGAAVFPVRQRDSAAIRHREVILTILASRFASKPRVLLPEKSL
jgi:hypothetical protein